MACRCSKNRTATSWSASASSRPSKPRHEVKQGYDHIAKDGTVTEYGSRLEALAARIRLGGEIRPR